jgi:drug/metabolite transporter (DMT)-like permease
MSSVASVMQTAKFLTPELRQSIIEKLWIIAALVLGAAEPIVVKYGYRGGLGPYQFFIVRNIVGALTLAPIFLYYSFKRPNQSKPVKPVIPIALLLMGTSFCTILALRGLSAVTVLTVVTSTPALVAIINEKLGRDILGNKFWLGFWLCFAGVVLSMPFDNYSGDWLGTIAVVLAIFTSGFYRVKMDEITIKHDPIYIASLCFIILGLISLAFLPFIGRLSPYDICYGIGIGISAALANVAFIKSLSLVGATRISVIAMVQRPAFILLAALILREVPTLLQILGIILVAIGVNFAKVKRAI